MIEEVSRRPARIVLDVPNDEFEAAALKEFKSQTQDLTIPGNADDYFYLRWLRARELNLVKAREMLEAYLKWKAESKLLPFDYNPPQLILDEAPLGISGYDHEGRPVVFAHGGCPNYKLIFDTGLAEALMHYMHSKFLAGMRAAEDRSRKTNGGVTHCVVLVDLEGMGVRKAMNTDLLRIAVTFAKALEAFYPELLHRIYVVNATWTFTFLFNLIRPFLSTVTHEKVQVYGTDSEQWKRGLLNDLPENCIPNELGGTAGSMRDLKM